jgi:flavin-dependent dehydrogenase
VRRADTLIVGGGPAGAATAIALAKSGTALILEREREPGDALCGGFLSWTALARLERLGVDAAALGARQITRLGLFAGQRKAWSDLPAPAAALSRRTLDAGLQHCAERAGAGVERGVRVRAITGDGAQLSDSTDIPAGRVVLATGKHELNGWPRQTDLRDSVLGLRWRLTPAAPLSKIVDGTIELHCFRGGYAGLVLQEDGCANLCLAVRQSRFDEAGKTPAALLEALAREAPSLAWRLDHATNIADAQAIANVPYGWRFRPGSDDRRSPYRVGDQAGVIASLSGEGISLALMSGMAAAQAIRRGANPGRFHARLQQRLGRPIRLAQGMMQMIERPAGAWLATSAAAAAPALMRLSARALRINPTKT